VRGLTHLSRELRLRFRGILLFAQCKILRLILHLHGKNDFAEGSKIFLDTDLKIILLEIKNNEQCRQKFCLV